MKRTLVYGTATALVALSLGGCAQATTGENASGTSASQDDVTSPSQTDADGLDEEPEPDIYGPPVIMDDGGNGWDDSVAEAIYGPPPIVDGEDADAYGIRVEPDGTDEASVSQ